MTEREYEVATDLAKLRLAVRCLRDLNPHLRSEDGALCEPLRTALTDIESCIEQLQEEVSQSMKSGLTRHPYGYRLGGERA